MSKSNLSKPIYLDYNATTPVDPVVKAAMLPYFDEIFGNPSSASHSYGWEADGAVKKARRQVADLVGSESSEIIFTSGATESNNLALQGTICPFLERGEKAHLITTEIEHKCVLDVSKALEKLGAEVTFLKPNEHGIVTVDQVLAALKPHTKLVSIIHAQNEIGSLNDIAKIGEALTTKKIPFHTDAAQSVGKIPMNVNKMKIDMLSASSQKMYGPKGVGFLYRRKDHPNLDLQPIMWGGTQEGGIRPGTLNVPGIVGLGKACEISLSTMHNDAERVGALQKYLIQEALKSSPDIRLNGHPVDRIYSNISLTFHNLSSDLFALGLSGLAVSTSSACAGGAPSYVLAAIGHTPEQARSTVRIGIGRFTSKQDVETAIHKIKDLVQKNAAISR